MHGQMYANATATAYTSAKAESINGRYLVRSTLPKDLNCTSRWASVRSCELLCAESDRQPG